MSTSSISAFLDPALCANNQKDLCTAVDVNFRCGGCSMVQYCSDTCQRADWPRHKKQCRSPFMKGTWMPEWYRQLRKPSFMSEPFLYKPGGPLFHQYGQSKFPWGNMPALDVLRVEDNEGESYATNYDFNLLFAASGDLRNIIKTITGLPAEYTAECTVVVNDMEFLIVARNAIMLLIAIKFEPEVATPMIIHLWYSALLPSCMIQTIRDQIMPMILQVCETMPQMSDDQLHTHTIEVEDRKVCVSLGKKQWQQLATFCEIHGDLTAEKAQGTRRAILLAPERIDYRDRRMLGKPANIRQGDTHFRDTGVFLPYGCSTKDFVLPNPTLFPNNEWPTRDDANPREGWLYEEYIKAASAAKGDEFGAIFFHVRCLLLGFCKQLRSNKVSFRLFNMDAQNLGNHLGEMRFDRIEVSNISDGAYLGSQACIRAFSPLLKERSQNPHATLLILFMSAIPEIKYALNPPVFERSLEAGIELIERYSPTDASTMNMKLALLDISPHPDFFLRMHQRNLFGPWDSIFNASVKLEQMPEVAKECGVAIKGIRAHTIVKPWPYRLGEDSTKEEFDALLASHRGGHERYVEIVRLDEEGNEAHPDDTDPYLGSKDVYHLWEPRKPRLDLERLSLKDS